MCRKESYCDIQKPSMENSALAIPNSNNYSAAEKQEGYKMKTTKGGVIFATNLDAHKSHVGSFMDTSPLLGKMVKKRMIKKKKKKRRREVWPETKSVFQWRTRRKKLLQAIKSLEDSIRNN